MLCSGGSRTTATVVSSVLALVVAGLGMTAAAPSAAAAVATRVIGLGDSYASGEGAGSYDPDTDAPLNQCHRSPLSWQRTAEIPGATGVERVHVACSGATVASVLSTSHQGEPPQIGALQNVPAGSVVLLSIGGNDVGFEAIVRDCVFGGCLETPAQVAEVQAKIAAAALEIRRALDTVVARAPGATVVLAGYPQLMQGACFTITPTEAGALDRLSVELRRQTVGQVMQLRLAGKSVRFADTIDPFLGHGACSDSDPWLNSLVAGNFSAESFHPNAAGYRAYATAVTNVLRADPMRCTAAGCRIRFARESVYHSVSGGTRATMGYIRSAYEAEGEEASYFGYPATDEYDRPNGRGQSFTRGHIYFRFGTDRAYPTRGFIGSKYLLTGDAAGRLGYPVSTEFTVPSGGGKRQNFQLGSIFFKNGTTEAFVSEGPILDKYRIERYDEGPLGWPTTDYACGLQPGNACRQHFDGSGDSVVYWTPETGAHPVTGPFRDFYKSGGWQNSLPNPDSSRIAGYPRTDVFTGTGMGYPTQQFQYGSIVHDVPKRTMCWVVNSTVRWCRPATA